MSRIVLALLIAASAASADVVVERWGAGGHVQHAKTLTYVNDDAGTIARFDLSALPKDAKVHRARLLMARSGGYAESFEVLPIEKIDRGKVVARTKPLAPVPPYCRWFDVSDLAAGWAKAGKAELLIRGGGHNPDATMLEIAYEGKLADPPKQVAAVKAFYRAGQVFITFTEIEDLTEGNDRYSWGSLIKKTRGYTPDGIVPNDDPRELRYRVYRSDKPITSQTIGSAELLAEVVPASGVNTRIVKRIWQGEQVPSKLDDAFVAVRLAVEPEKPVPSGTGVYVHTVNSPRRKVGVGGEAAPNPPLPRGAIEKAYYAVVTAINGVENTVDLASAVAGPIDQQVAPPEPVLQQTEVANEGKPDELITRRYAMWAAPPLSERPLQYCVTVQWYPKKVADPGALEVNHGHSHAYTLQRRQRADSYMLVPEDGPETPMYVGANNCHTTLKSYAQGTWAPWTYRRTARIVEWARTAYHIDDQDIFVYGSHWGMWYLRHPEIYSVFIGWGSGELTKGFVDWNRANGCWGPPSAFEGKPDEENPYVMTDMTRYVSADPSRRLPAQFLIPCTGSHTSEMSFPALSRYKRALMNARQPMFADIGKVSWGFAVPVALNAYRSGKLKVRRDQSKPAFANCTIDDNPGNGDYRSGDPVGLLNGYLLWETETIVDEPGRWEMTVSLDKSAPRDACGVDLTPRDCVKFAAKSGEKFRWTNTDLAEKKAVGSGDVTADKYGLVTLEQIVVGQAGNRVSIEKK